MSAGFSVKSRGGCTNEMLRVCLDDAEILSLLFNAAEDFARGHIPDDVTRCLLLATMTATPKESRSWGHLLGIRSFCQLSSSSGWSKSENCGTPSLQCRTFNVHGSSSSNAQGRVATTCCGSCPPVSYSGTPGHDAGMQRAMEVWLGSLPGDDAQVEMARHITTLPSRMGGLGLRSALRMAQQHSGAVGG